MKIIGMILVILILLAMVVGTGYGIYTGYKFFTAEWTVLNVDMKACMIIIISVLITCTLFISVSFRSLIKKHGLLSKGKVIAYNQFINWYSEVLNNNGEKLNSNSFKTIKNHIMLWGNNQVVAQTNVLYEMLKDNKESTEIMLAKADHVYLEIRRDLGHRNYRVDRSII